LEENENKFIRLAVATKYQERMFASLTLKFKRKRSSSSTSTSHSKENTVVEVKYSPFAYVPTEIKVLIFSFLNCESLIAVSRVCREWNRVTTDFLLFRPFILKLSPLGTLPEPRVCQAAATYENSLIVHGGHFPTSPHFYINNVKNDMFEYNFLTKTWAQVPGEFPFRTEHSIVAHDKYLYIFGGYGPHRYSNDLHRYNPETKECVEIVTAGTPPSPRSAHSAVVYEDKMYIYGGWNGQQSSNDFFVFDFKSSFWTQLEVKGEVLPSLRSHNAVVYNHCMYITGGYGEDKAHPSELYKFDFKTEEWTVVPSKGCPPCGRSRSRSIVFEDKLFVVGGWDRKNYFSDLYEFSFKLSSWKKVDIAFEESIGQHNLAIHNGIMFSFGGFLGKPQTPCNLLFACRLK